MTKQACALGESFPVGSRNSQGTALTHLDAVLLLGAGRLLSVTLVWPWIVSAGVVTGVIGVLRPLRRVILHLGRTELAQLLHRLSVLLQLQQTTAVKGNGSEFINAAEILTFNTTWRMIHKPVRLPESKTKWQQNVQWKSTVTGIGSNNYCQSFAKRCAQRRHFATQFSQHKHFRKNLGIGMSFSTESRKSNPTLKQVTIVNKATDQRSGHTVHTITAVGNNWNWIKGERVQFKPVQCWTVWKQTLLSLCGWGGDKPPRGLINYLYSIQCHAAVLPNMNITHIHSHQIFRVFLPTLAVIFLPKKIRPKTRLWHWIQNWFPHQDKRSLKKKSCSWKIHTMVVDFFLPLVGAAASIVEPSPGEVVFFGGLRFFEACISSYFCRSFADNFCNETKDFRAICKSVHYCLLSKSEEGRKEISLTFRKASISFSYLWCSFFLFSLYSSRCSSVISFHRRLISFIRSFDFNSVNFNNSSVENSW